MKEKCFCHLKSKETGESYAVKDATARKQITEILERIGVIDNEIVKDIEALKTAREELEKAIELAEESVDINRLENNVKTLSEDVLRCKTSLSKKIDRIENTGNQFKIYAEKQNNGGTHLLSSAVTVTGNINNTVVLRGSDGQIHTITPIDDDHVAPKKFVEDTATKIVTKLLNEADLNGGVWLSPTEATDFYHITKIEFENTPFIRVKNSDGEFDYFNSGRCVSKIFTKNRGDGGWNVGDIGWYDSLVQKAFIPGLTSVTIKQTADPSIYVASAISMGLLIDFATGEIKKETGYFHESSSSFNDPKVIKVYEVQE